MIKEERDIEEEVISYFTSLYAPAIVSRLFLEGLDWDPISVRSKEDLEIPFTLEVH